jgi:hypothetical protein
MKQLMQSASREIHLVAHRFTMLTVEPLKAAGIILLARGWEGRESGWAADEAQQNNDLTYRRRFTRQVATFASISCLARARWRLRVWYPHAVSQTLAATDWTDKAQLQGVRAISRSTLDCFLA